MDWQINSILFLQQVPALTGLMQILSFLGREEFFLLLIPLVYLAMDARAGFRLGVLLLLGDSLNSLTKVAFHEPRPYWVDARIRPLALETSYGFPSSHAQNAVTIWPFFALLLKKPWAWIAAVCIVVLVSLSRLYLGVHFWGDIVGGWLIGLLVLFLCWRLWPRVEAWFLLQEMRVQIISSAAVSLVILAIGILLMTALARVNEPAAWAAHAHDARSLQPLVGRCGALFGLGVGWSLSLRWGRFEAGGPVALRLVRVAIGVAGVLVCWKGLQAVFPREPEAVELLFRFVRYALLSLWITFLAPWLFLRWKLAQPCSGSISEPSPASTAKLDHA